MKHLLAALARRMPSDIADRHTELPTGEGGYQTYTRKKSADVCTSMYMYLCSLVFLTCPLSTRVPCLVLRNASYRNLIRALNVRLRASSTWKWCVVSFCWTVWHSYSTPPLGIYLIRISQDFKDFEPFPRQINDDHNEKPSVLIVLLCCSLTSG